MKQSLSNPNFGKEYGAAQLVPKKTIDHVLEAYNSCVYAVSPEIFEVELGKASELGLRARDKARIVSTFDWVPRDQWSFAFSQGMHCGRTASQLSESFNSTLRVARAVPIVGMLEQMRRWLVEKIVARRDEAAQQLSDGRFVSKIVWENQVIPVVTQSAKLQQVKIKAIDADRYVVEYDDRRRTVDLGLFECSCLVWQKRFTKAIPCEHAIRVIKKRGLNLIDFLHPDFKLERILQAYTAAIEPGTYQDIDLHALEVDDSLQAPPFQQGRGRPRNKRDRSNPMLSDLKKRAKGQPSGVLTTDLFQALCPGYESAESGSD